MHLKFLKFEMPRYLEGCEISKKIADDLILAALTYCFTLTAFLSKVDFCISV